MVVWGIVKLVSYFMIAVSPRLLWIRPALGLTRSIQSHLALFVHHLWSVRVTESVRQPMKVKIKSWHAIAQWRWDTGNTDHDEGDGEGDVCGICRVPYEGCCPTCKVPGDDCPLSEYTTRSSGTFVTNSCAVWGECSHVFHMHCLLKWIGTPASKQQCPMDRRTWGRSPLPK